MHSFFQNITEKGLTVSRIVVYSATMALMKINEPPRDKTNKMACVPNEDSDQPGHPPSLIRVFAVCSVGS